MHQTCTAAYDHEALREDGGFWTICIWLWSGGELTVIVSFSPMATGEALSIESLNTWDGVSDNAQKSPFRREVQERSEDVIFTGAYSGWPLDDEITPTITWEGKGEGGWELSQPSGDGRSRRRAKNFTVWVLDMGTSPDPLPIAIKSRAAAMPLGG